MVVCLQIETTSCLQDRRDLQLVLSHLKDIFIFLALDESESCTNFLWKDRVPFNHIIATYE